MNKPPYLVDEKVCDLAEHFLSDTDAGDEASEDRQWDLANVIQNAVEDWFDGSMLQRGGSGVPESQGIDVPGSTPNPGAHPK